MIFLLILIFLIFIPIPIKLNILYKDLNINLKLYNKSIISFDFKPDSTNKKAKKKLKKANKKLSFFKKHLEHKELMIQKFLKNLSSSRFKPLVNFKTDIDFGISDAATCAIVYGLLWNLYTLIRIPLELVFKIKNISLSINPRFNTNYLLFNINSIFYISLANIIYIMFLLFKSSKNKEEIINE